MPDQPEVPITQTNRGFQVYGPPVATQYGHVLEFQESSVATGPHLWMFVDTSNSVIAAQEADGRIGVHMDEAQARLAHAELGAFLDGIAERWS